MTVLSNLITELKTNYDSVTAIVGNHLEEQYHKVLSGQLSVPEFCNQINSERFEKKVSQRAILTYHQCVEMIIRLGQNQ